MTEVTEHGFDGRPVTRGACPECGADTGQSPPMPARWFEHWHTNPDGPSTRCKGSGRAVPAAPSGGPS